MPNAFPEMRPRRRWLSAAFAVVIGLAAWLNVELWLGDEGLPRVDALNQRITAQQAENRTLAARNAAMAADVDDLKAGREAVEERARQELGMVRADEVFYQVVEVPSDDVERAPVDQPDSADQR